MTHINYTHSRKTQQSISNSDGHGHAGLLFSDMGILVGQIRCLPTRCNRDRDFRSSPRTLASAPKQFEVPSFTLIPGILDDSPRRSCHDQSANAASRKSYALFCGPSRSAAVAIGASSVLIIKLLVVLSVQHRFQLNLSQSTWKRY
jgi:hypothetical protein